MTMIPPWHPSRGDVPGGQVPDGPSDHTPSESAHRHSFFAPDDAIESQPDPYLPVADCCGAPGSFRVILPAAMRAHRPAELIFCGHHVRAFRRGLEAAGAIVFDQDKRLAPCTF